MSATVQLGPEDLAEQQYLGRLCDEASFREARAIPDPVEGVRFLLRRLNCRLDEPLPIDAEGVRGFVQAMQRLLRETEA